MEPFQRRLEAVPLQAQDRGLGLLLALADDVEPRQRLVQRARLAHVARQDLATAREACAVECQRQRDQGIIVALLLGAPEPGTLVVGVAVVVNVGEIVEGDRLGQVEQRALTVEQLPLDGGPVSPEQVADAVECLAPQRLAVAF